ncbi:sensor histidine kinase [Schaalia vaccimaxillae]|uniref:sensor histidine kinase n=1 Tax=Schaalia vaccimaxillae TaxID=183916 RepID=UPI0003B46FE6|nr:ATP-binding protein [Schaalia vaccimaxillae]
MPEILTLIVVAVLGVVVGAVGVGAFRFSQRQIERDESVAPEIDPGLSSDALAILTSLPEITIVIEKDGSVMRAGAAAYAKGITRGDDLAHERIREMVRISLESGLSATEDLQLPRSSVDHSGLLDFRVRVSPLPGGRALILVEDQTIQRRNESARRDFTANISHELKTPIGSLRLLAETIAENPDDTEAVRHFAPSLVRESDRLATLVKDIIDLSRLEAPDPLSNAQVVDMDEVVAIALGREETTAAKAGIELIGPDQPSGAQVWGDLDTLITAVRNLVDNAVRYSESGDRVCVGIIDEDGLVSVSVVDSGIGISEEEQERIFERFYRVDPARSRNTGGTGLGLSIVKHVASDHGGTVTVWSKEGRGSTFTLVIPGVDVGGIEPVDQAVNMETATVPAPGPASFERNTQL